MRHSHLPLLAAAILLTPFVAHAGDEGVPWRTDAQAAVAEAQQSGKLVLMHFWTKSCGPCRMLDKRVFAQPGVAGAITANYVPVKINAAESPELAKAYGVTRVPTDVVTDSRGQLIRSFVSPATPMAYMGLMTELAAQQRTKVSPYGDLAAQAPYAVQHGTTSVPPVTPMQTAAAPATTTIPTMPQQTASAPVGGVPATTPQNAVAPQVALNPNYQPAQHAIVPAAPAVPQPQPQSQPQLQPQPPAAASVASSASQPAATPAASKAPQLPPGSPPLAFDGYCSVTMKKNWEWRKGDVRFGAIHRGRTYLFATAENRDVFLATPDEFAPALSGADPVVAVDQRQSVPGSRQFAVEYKGRFYFFASEETLSRFWTNADGYATGAERVAAATADTVVR